MKKLIIALVAVGVLTSCATTETYRLVREDGANTCFLVYTKDEPGQDNDFEFNIPCEVPVGETILVKTFNGGK